MRVTRALAAILLLLCAAPAHAGTLSLVTFTTASPLSGNLELARRLLRPLEYAELEDKLARGARLAPQPLDPAQERFALYVPEHMPAAGYGLVVFVPPWDSPRLPDGWGAVLDASGTILVSAAKSGNDQSVLARREPLALIGESNVAERYPLNPQRIYLAGFSGGSRVAERLALAYPDVFRGAILDAGSDPIGNPQLPLPPRQLFAQFQQATHLVFVAGDNDSLATSANASTLRSLRRWCVFGVDERALMNEGHDAMDGAALAAALELLAKPGAPGGANLAQCRAANESALAAQLAAARASLASGAREHAQELITSIDAEYGGLAEPDIFALARAAGLP